MLGVALAAMHLLVSASSEDAAIAASPDAPTALTSNIEVQKPVAGKPADWTQGSGPADQGGVAPGAGAAGLSSADNSDDGKAARVEPVAYLMDSAERLQLRVRGQPELSGEYAIDSEGRIGIAGIGRLRVGSYTLEQLETVLSRRLSQVARRETTVSVEVTKYKPYYVMGLVTHTGAYDWRPGLNVVQTLALAGGAASRQVEARRDGEEDQSALRLRRLKLHFMLTELARLTAERQGKQSIEITNEHRRLIASEPSLRLADLDVVVTQQNELLAGRQALLEQQVRTLERERDMAGDEVASLETIKKAMEEQGAVSREILTEVKGLFDKKVVSRQRLLSQKSQVLTESIGMAELANKLARARAAGAASARKVAQIRDERRKVLTEQIESIRREAMQLELALVDADRASHAGAEEFRLEYSIARKGSGSVTTFHADLFTQVEYGDVVIVSGKTVLPSLKLGATAAQAGALAEGPASLQNAIEAFSLLRPREAERVGVRGGRDAKR